MAQAGAHAGQPVATHTPSLAAAYPTWSTARPTPPPSTGSTWCSWPCPTASPSTWCPTWSTGWAWWSTWPPTSGWPTPPLYPTWYGEAHLAPELLATFVYGLPELHRGRPGRRHPDRRARAATRRPPCWPWPRWSGPASWPCPADGGARPLVVDAASGTSGAGRAPEGPPALRRGRRGLRGLRAARPPPHRRDGAGTRHHRCCSRPTSPRWSGASWPPATPDPPTPAALTTEDAMQLLHDRYDDEPFVVVGRRPAVDQGGQRLEHRPPVGPGRPPHRVGGGAVAPSTT